MYTNYNNYQRTNYNTNTFRAKTKEKTLTTAIKELKRNLSVYTNTEVNLPKSFIDGIEAAKLKIENSKEEAAKKVLKMEILVRDKNRGTSSIDTFIIKGSLQDIRDYLTNKNIVDYLLIIGRTLKTDSATDLNRC